MTFKRFTATVSEDLRFMLICENRPHEMSLRTAGFVIAYLITRPGALATLLYRISRELHLMRLKPLGYAVARANAIINGIEVPPTVDIGPGFVIYHPQGIVLHGDSKAGERFRIHSGAVVGIRGSSDEHGDGPPLIGDDVLVGTGAKMLGPITIGDRARIGANAVVTRTVPADCTATGIPATHRRNLK